MTHLEKKAQAALKQYRDQNLERRLFSVSQVKPAMVVGDGQMIDMASNDYLGLSLHPVLIERAKHWIDYYGIGARSSRLVSGTLEAMQDVERKLAAFKNKPAACFFSSGWQANVSVVRSFIDLLGRRDVRVFSDRLNHASLHEACRGIHQHRYRHHDLNHLSDLLKKHAVTGQPPLVLTESVFSMDGDTTPVDELVLLCEQYGATLYLDEAHASGVLGPSGAGLATKWPNVVVMSTLGKAFGVSGAFVAASSAVIKWLQQGSSGFAYSTAPSPALFGAVEAALELMPRLDSARHELLSRATQLRHLILEKKHSPGASDTQIVPIILDSVKSVLQFQSELASQGIMVGAIRPPTVPANVPRLRVCVNMGVTVQEFEKVKQVLGRLL